MKKITLPFCGFFVCLLVSQSSQAACDFTGAWRIIQDNGPVVEIHIETTSSTPFGVVGSDGGTLGSIEKLFITQSSASSPSSLAMQIRWLPTKGDEDRRELQLGAYLGYIRSDGKLHGVTWSKGIMAQWQSDKMFQC